MQRIVSFLFLLASATPALAQGSISVPEPTDIALFGLAVAGLIIGRRSSKTPPKDSDDA